MACNKIIDQTIRKRILLALLQSCGDACGRIFVQRMGYYRCHLQSARPHPAERESLVAISVRSPQYHLPKATPPTHHSVSIRMACNCNTFTYIHTQVAQLLNVIVIATNMHLCMMMSSQTFPQLEDVEISIEIKCDAVFLLFEKEDPGLIKIRVCQQNQVT